MAATANSCAVNGSSNFLYPRPCNKMTGSNIDIDVLDFQKERPEEAEDDAHHDELIDVSEPSSSLSLLVEASEEDTKCTIFESSSYGARNSSSSFNKRVSSSRLRTRTSEIESTLSKQLAPSQEPPASKTNTILEALTINKLKYNSIGLVGREQEIHQLQTCFARLLNQKKKELITIEGYSGVGKSSLARTLKQPSSTEQHFMAEGKFEVFSSEPYAAIIQVFGTICKRLDQERPLKKNQSAAQAQQDHAPVSSSSAELTFPRTTTNEEEESIIPVDDQPVVELLVKLIPELAALLPTGSTQRRGSNSTTGSSGSEEDLSVTQEKWKYAFRVLTRIVCLYFTSLVLILDDLQWADASSWDVLDCILTDTENDHALMIVGCYRSNEVSSGDLLAERIENLSTKNKKYEFEMTEIKLGPLSENDVLHVLMGMLSMDADDKTSSSLRGLAAICFRRTLGNPHFLIQFVTMLKDENLLVFNLALLRWIWDVDAIENNTMSSGNVVDLLQTRMKKLPEDVQLLLQYAACLGSSFKQSTLYLLWTPDKENKGTSNDEDGEAKFASLLDVLQEGSFIESFGKSTFRWVHDQVQTAALTLGDASSADFQWRVGEKLYNSVDCQGLKELLFDVVKLINKGNAMDGKPEYAELNLKAAEEARRISAFQSSATFCLNGIKWLPMKEKWTTYRSITLPLYALGAQTELVNGDTDTAEKYNEAVLEQRDFTPLEKLPFNIVKIKKLSSIDMAYSEAINMSLAVLKELGCNLIPSRAMLPAHAVFSLLQTIRRARRKPRDFFWNQPKLNDPRRNAIVKVLSRLVYASFLEDNDYIFILCVTQFVHLTLEYGLHSGSGEAFASLGLLTKLVLGDFATAKAFAETALLLQARSGDKYGAASTLYITTNFVLSWSKNLQSCQYMFLDSFHIGMRSGNVEYAMWSLLAYHIELPYLLGKRLPKILARCPDMLSQMEDLKQKDHVFFITLYWQMLLNLSGQSEETTVLKGEIFDAFETPGKSPLQTVNINFAKLELLVFYGDFEAAAEHALKCGNSYEEPAGGGFLTALETFHRGVALFAMARKFGKRRYKAAAKSILKKLCVWMEHGNPNVQYYHSLLRAEQAVLDKKFHKAEDLYKQAVVQSARPGHLHHAALINERYADFLEHEGSHITDAQDEANYRIKDAIRFYSEWGAEKKVAMLQMKKSEL